MLPSRFLPLVLLLAPATLYAQAAPINVRSDADALAEQVRRLGNSPQDLDALLTAGELSIRLDDLSAAGAFFARAEKVSPGTARVKAGEGAILVHSERPVEALRFFAQAEQLGLAPARFAAERGLAYDLIGDPVRAQREYQLALAAGDDPETRRRYALSLAVAGRQREALGELDPLIRANDRAAWRSRAFVLAMGGDTAGATRIAETMMPPGSATALQSFFTELPRLSPVDKAFAVQFGEVQATPQRIADARLPHAAPLPLPPAAVVSIPAVGAVRNDRRNRRGRRNEVQVAAVALPPPPPLPEPPAYEAVYAPPAASTPVRDRPLSPGEQAALVAGGNRVPTDRSRRDRTLTAPVVTRALTAAEERSLASAGGVTAAPPVLVAPSPSVVARPPVAVAAIPVTRPSPAPGVPIVTRALTVEEQASLAAAAGPPARPPVARAEAVRPGFSAAASTVEIAATGTAAPDAPLSPPVTAPVPPVTARASSAPARARPSRRVAYAQTDSVLSRIVAGLSIPAAELDVAAAVPTAADRRAAERRAAADKKAAADRKAAADAKAQADREAAEVRRAARAEPARVWVQVAGGANEAGLPQAWRTMQGRAPDVLTGRQAWTTPLRATNRVLTGPFRTEAEAQAVVTRLGKAGVSAFTFTSDAGQKVTRLTTR